MVRKAGVGIGLGVGAAGLLALAACERGASAPSRAQRDEAPASSSAPTGGGSYADSGAFPSRDRGGYAPAGDDRAPRGAGAETPLFKGKPLWADNRRHTARENAEYQCGKHGGDIGASSLDECLTKVHAFVDAPPAGSETATRARNGDRLMYDARSNLFVVARKDGAPRTFFKPREGAGYWREQKEEAQSGRSAARRGGDEGTGAGG